VTDEQLEPRGIAFPADPEGRRSTTRVGRATVADALRAVDPGGAAHAERETNWRTGYLLHFRRLVEAGLGSREAALSIAEAGSTSLRSQLTVVNGGEEVPLDTWAAGEATQRLDCVEITGDETAETELTLPFHGSRLQGDALRGRLDSWVSDGVLEPSAADAVRTVMEHPDWLRLEGRTVAVVGAGSEMGPLQSLLRWGARVAAVDLPRPAVWERLERIPSAGTMLVPVRPDGDAAVTQRAGGDLVEEVPALAEWLTTLDAESMVIGNYVYADGADNVRVSAAVDALTTRLTNDLDDVALAFLATPTDVFAVPGDAVGQATSNYDSRSRLGRVLGRPLRTVSGGRLLQRAYVPGSDPGINDSLVPQQGPNYALAKRLQRWRATVARAAGTTVSLNVAPPTRTRSVVKNRALAAAYAGAHRFGVEVFEPATSNVLMAALLVHDLNTGGGPSHDHPWQDEAHAAVHGGLWRAPYTPRSALGLAAVLGYGSARG
jgi:hypothetical protein